MSSTIEFDNVGKTFPVRGVDGPFHALDGVDLKVRAGEFLTLVGPSGCGKSTLLDLVAGLSAPSSRYSRATEFVEVVTRLWDSWEDGAILADQESGVYADTGRIRPIGHRGRHLQVEGPLNIARPPQGRPTCSAWS